MSSVGPEPDCLICQEQDGRVAVPGGFLADDPLVVAFHCPPLPDAASPYLGHLFVTPRRHVASFAGLEPPEAAAMGQAIASLSSALEREGASRVYLATIGHGCPHLHVHLVPRWPETPEEVAWSEVDAWEGARRGDASTIDALVERLRGHVAG